MEELAVREQWFKIAVFSFSEYDNNMLEKFYNYWSEPTKSGKKMKFELEKTWDIKRRLQRWFDNDLNWNKNANSKNQQSVNLRQQVQQEFNKRYGGGR